MSRAVKKFFSRKVSQVFSDEIVVQAIRNDNLEIIAAFLKQTKNPNILIDGKPLPHHAAIYNKPELLKIFLRNKKSDINCVDSEGKTALYRACENNSAGAAMLLLTAKADVNKSSPLEAAVLGNHTAIIKMLSSYDAIFDSQRLSHIAAEGGYHEALAIILEKIPPEQISKLLSSVEVAASTLLTPENDDHAKDLRITIGLLFDSLLQNTNIASKIGSQKFLETLASSGELGLFQEIITKLDAAGFYSGFEFGKYLETAIKTNQLELVKFLVDNNKASPHISTGNSGNYYYDRDPLTLAIKNPSPEIVKFLAEKNKSEIKKDYAAHLLTTLIKSGRIDLIDSIEEIIGLSNERLLLELILNLQNIENSSIYKREAEEFKQYEEFALAIIARLNAQEIQEDSDILHDIVRYQISDNVLSALYNKFDFNKPHSKTGDSILTNCRDPKKIQDLISLEAKTDFIKTYTKKDDSKTPKKPEDKSVTDFTKSLSEILHTYKDNFCCSITFEPMTKALCFIKDDAAHSFQDTPEIRSLDVCPVTRAESFTKITDVAIKKFTEFLQDVFSYSSALKIYSEIYYGKNPPMENCDLATLSKISEFLEKNAEPTDLAAALQSKILQTPESLLHEGKIMDDPYINITSGISVQGESPQGNKEGYVKHFTLEDFVNSYEKMCGEISKLQLPKTNPKDPEASAALKNVVEQKIMGGS